MKKKVKYLKYFKIVFINGTKIFFLHSTCACAALEIVLSGLSCTPHFGHHCLGRWECLQRPGQKESSVFRLRLTKERADYFLMKI